MKIEQLSFELAQTKYKQQLQALKEQGRAHEMATSHRYILKWIEVLQSSISEQQKIALKRGELDNKKIGYYLMTLPADAIASLCVTHLVKQLLKELVDDMHHEADRQSQVGKGNSI